ncbi:hypothetical protein X734_06950 [Mesorhizobium sp. L2C084A000]|nr:hypothetical protein X734_06950 [Mesorhizobium sp. L2C084A000]
MKAGAGSDDAADAGRIQMRAGDETMIVGCKRQQPQPAFARLVLIGVEFPCHLRSIELKRWDVNGVAPNQNGFAAGRNTKAAVSRFMAMSADNVDMCPDTVSGFEGFRHAVKSFEPRFGAKKAEFFPGNEQARQARESVAAVGKHKTMDVVEMRVGEADGTDSSCIDASFVQRLGKSAHGGMPGVRGAGIDQDDPVSIVNREGIDGKPELTTNQRDLLRQFIAKWLVAALPKPSDRHVDIAIAQGGDAQVTKIVGLIKVA